MPGRGLGLRLGLSNFHQHRLRLRLGLTDFHQHRRRRDATKIVLCKHAPVQQP